MSRSEEVTARNAAARLAGELGDPGLPALTERVLATGDDEAPARSYDAGVAIALAALVVSVSQLAWQIYRDLRADREKTAAATDRAATPVRQLLVRRLRLRAAEPSGLAAARRERVIEVVVEELLTAEDRSRR